MEINKNEFLQVDLGKRLQKHQINKSHREKTSNASNEAFLEKRLQKHQIITFFPRKDFKNA